MVFYTSVCANYLDKASVLADSVKKHMPKSTFVVGLVEETLPSLPYSKNIDHVFLAKDLEIPHFRSFMFRHRIVEASTAIKGHLSLYMMKKFTAENYFAYMDPDTCAFSDFEADLSRHLEDAPIGLTPHLLAPGNIDMEISSLKHGVFNLGFLALKRSEMAKKCLQWWSERLLHYCYEDFMAGLFTDQKWINLAPCFFDTKIIRDPGYNFATWNFLERKLAVNNGDYTVDSVALKFVHFSGYDSGTFDWAAKQWGNEQNLKLGTQLSNDYREKLSAYAQFKKHPWSYATFSSGAVITDDVRMEMRKNPLGQVSDPFNETHA